MHGKPPKDGRHDIESIEGDISGFMGDPGNVGNSAINSDDEIGRGSGGSDGDDNDQA